MVTIVTMVVEFKPSVVQTRDARV